MNWERRERRGSGEFECPVCLDTIPWTDGLRLQNCHHWCCKECLKGYLRSKLSDKVAELTCPEPHCRTPLQNNDIQSLGAAQLWNKYADLATQTFLERAAGQNNNGIRRCPAERCNFMFQFEPDWVNGNGKLFICPECNNSFCLNCPVVNNRVGPAHDGGCQRALGVMLRSNEEKRKIAEWKKLNEQADSRFNELMHRERANGITKPCPRCMVPITKNSGCDHMHCGNCGLHYSWANAY